jgi:hypothetical protein
MKPQITQEQILQIVKNNFYGIDTIETRNSDSLDFHDTAIWCIRSAIENAYKIGYQQAIEDKKRKRKPK